MLINLSKCLLSNFVYALGQKPIKVYKRNYPVTSFEFTQKFSIFLLIMRKNVWNVDKNHFQPCFFFLFACLPMCLNSDAQPKKEKS